jgi:uncharacterized protein (TIGR02996 family)
MSPDLEPLLAALTEDPSDREMRAVVSDAMEERGRILEAELLRSNGMIEVIDGLIFAITRYASINGIGMVSVRIAEDVVPGQIVTIDSEGFMRPFRQGGRDRPRGICLG